MTFKVGDKVRLTGSGWSQHENLAGKTVTIYGVQYGAGKFLHEGYPYFVWDPEDRLSQDEAYYLGELVEELVTEGEITVVANTDPAQEAITLSVGAETAIRDALSRTTYTLEPLDLSDETIAKIVNQLYARLYPVIVAPPSYPAYPQPFYPGYAYPQVWGGVSTVADTKTQIWNGDAP